MTPSNSLLSSQPYSVSYSQQNTNTFLASATLEDSEQSLRVSVQSYQSDTTTVTLSGEQQNPTYAVEEAQLPESAPAKSAQNNIVDFIALRLGLDAQEGATTEEIAQRLQEGYEGFISGYQQAYDELAASGLLSAEVEQVISQTYRDVLNGIEELASEYGVESPIPEAQLDSDTVVDGELQLGQLSSLVGFNQGGDQASPMELLNQFARERINEAENLSTLLEASRLDYDYTASRNFSFSLTTQDGDTVTIVASATESAGVDGVQAAYDQYNAASVNLEYSQSSRFSLAVEGELDEDELEAINDLLGQVGELSDRFYSGNIAEAFEMALNIGFDGSEIARFSLDLKQEVTAKVETAYAQFAPEANLLSNKSEFLQQMEFANGDNSIRRLFEFVKLLSDTMEKADNVGLDVTTLPQLAQNVANARDASAQNEESLAPFVQNIGDLLSGQKA